MDRLGPFELDALPQDLGRGARSPVSRGGSASSARSISRTASSASSPACAGCPPPDEDDTLGPGGCGPEIARLKRSTGRSRSTAAHSCGSCRPIRPSERTLAALAARATLAILSNWPLAATIDRYAAAAGWGPHLRAIIVSQRVGTIKPDPAIFAEARRLLGDPEPKSILHVGDDWAADVVGAVRAGWRAAYVRSRPHDSPLPTSERDLSVAPDLEIDQVGELVDLFRTVGRGAS